MLLYDLILQIQCNTPLLLKGNKKLKKKVIVIFTLKRIFCWSECARHEFSSFINMESKRKISIVKNYSNFHV